MKKYINTLIFLVCAFATLAQAPQKFNYQAVARNAQGSVLPNQNVKIRASILDDSANGTSQYSETHSVSTSQLGLFNLAIGGGTIVSGTFSNVTWASGDKYLKIEMDATGGNNFSLVGTSQLLSVPYALFSEKSNLQAGSGISISNNVIENVGDLDATNELQSLNLNGNTLQISNGNEVTLPNLPVYTGGQGIEVTGTTINNIGDLDNSPTNEFQSLNLNGNNLQISNGNTVTLPNPPIYTGGQGIEVNGTVINNTGDMDNSPTNELQQLTLSGNTLVLTNGSSVALPIPTAGVGIGVNGWQISNTGDVSNTNELQTLTLSGNTLSLSQSGGSVTLPNGGTSQWTTSGSNIYYNTGNVGVNTSSPSEKLHLAGKMKIDGTNTIEFGAGVSGKQADAGKIGYQSFSTNALDIIGAGNSGTSRKIKFWNEGGASFTGNIGLNNDNPTNPLSFSNDLGNKFSIFYSSASSQYGVGLQNGLFQIYCAASSDNIAFGYGSSTSFTELMRIKGNGNVGIGTNSPTQKLDVNGTIKATGLQVSTGAAAGKVLTSDASGNATWQTPSGGGSGQWTSVTGGIQYNSGKVLIGNATTPGNYQLYVEQGILAERVKVALKSTSHWADYVFLPSYKLMPLTEVEEFIKKNNHLPNVPSAEEVHKEGIDMATMDSKLLEKIEELTLYMIELKKENLALKERIGALEAQGNNNTQKK